MLDEEAQLTTRQKISIFGISLAIIVGIVSALTVIGREARLPDVLTIFCAGFAGGASLVALIRGRTK
jgi:hypothetical protein